ncbi:MAG: transporter related protein [Deltaproteobacteria bacterium]|jgi:branched-chain amino acid transport system ATP-binding protein|nr:transporter related protein [Deltaproteobacteria bacterium]
MLKIEELNVSYGGINALKGVSLEVGRDEIVTLLGANGAGKSTLLMAVSGVVPVRKGRIFFDGMEITGKSPSQIVKIGICQVPEGRDIFKNLSVIDNLILGSYHRYLSQKKEVMTDLERILELFPILRERSKQSAGKLSGGEQQMLAIGRALMARPRLIMLDEPSLGLAPLMVEEIFRIIGRLQAEEIPILLIEQNARAALRTATRGYVMETGSITLEGTSSDLLENPRVVSAYLGR